jgi:hypothetical protein
MKRARVHRKRKQRKAKPEEVTEGFKNMTEIVFDGVIKGAKYVYGTVTGEAQKAAVAAATAARVAEEQKRAVPRWAR